MSDRDKIIFFDSIADKWDSWEDLDKVQQKLAEHLSTLNMGKEDHVLDVGCGTGNLSKALLKILSSNGCVTAIDISGKMLAIVRQKISDPRLRLKQASALKIPLEDQTFDRIMCFSVWPHFDKPYETALELNRVLKKGGFLHIWHNLSRHRLNEIHAQASPAVKDDILPPAVESPTLLEKCGFKVMESADDQNGYSLTARK